MICELQDTKKQNWIKGKNCNHISTEQIQMKYWKRSSQQVNKVAPKAMKTNKTLKLQAVGKNLNCLAIYV